MSFINNRAVDVVADKGIAIGAEGVGLIPGSIKSNAISPTDRHAATFLRSCVVMTISRGDGLRHSLHALT